MGEHVPVQSVTSDRAVVHNDATAGQNESTSRPSLPDNTLIDYITGETVTETPKEQVRQRIARALFHEYGVAVEDMARDFPVTIEVDGKKRRRRIDIAVFQPNTSQSIQHLQRIVVCKPEPKNGNTVTRIRTPQQAEKDLAELRDLMGDERTPGIRYGMWTNGLELFFLEKTVERFGPRYTSIADWPLSGELGSRSVVSHARLRRAEPGMLKAAFRRCHNYIHGNEGMPKDVAFWQFLYLLFTKMYDERQSRERGINARFFAGLHEPFNTEGQREIAQRIRSLFDETKRRYPLFSARDELTLSDRALAFLVGELAPYDLTNTDIDAKGIAYQELVGANLRGDRGQYFTPRSAVELMVEILDPQEGEVVLDPACGTGGFLRETLRHLLNRWREAAGTVGLPDTEEQSVKYQARLESYARDRLFGTDFDPFLVRATSMNIMMLSGVEGNVYHLDSLAFPRGHLDGVPEAKRRIPLGGVDVLMTNPPFGADIKVTDPTILDQYRDGVAQSWTRDRTSGQLMTSANNPNVQSMSPEQLFIQRSVEWLRPGGRLGIVLPNGMLSNPGPIDEAIRRWILEHCWVLASVELPMQTFVAEANVNIITSLLFLQRKFDDEVRAGQLGAPQDYPIFMAIAEQVGFDRRGNPVYHRSPDGEIIMTEQIERERIRINGRSVDRVLHRKRPELDNDLPLIAKRYREFRQRYQVPGRPGRGRE
ncbi:MAG: methylation-associated defense system DNA methyltransferase MAD2 [Pseudonocardiaceae bacterium]